MDANKLIKAAIEMKGKSPTGDREQKDVARGLVEALQRARQKFLSEHPEAAKRPFVNDYKKVKKVKQEREAKSLREKIRKDPMSNKNHFSMAEVEDAYFSNNENYLKWRDFAINV